MSDGSIPAREWPSYLLKNIPPDLREALSREAEAEDESVSDIIRGVLCDHYRMTCRMRSLRYEPERDSRNTSTLLLRLQPSVRRCLMYEAYKTGRSMREIILEALTAHYQEVAA